MVNLSEIPRTMRSNRLIIIFLLAFYVGQSQESKFSLKPALGMTACQVHGDNYSGFNKVGFTGGAYVNAQLNKVLSTDLGLIFVQKGARKNSRPEKFDYTYYYLNLNYLEVPLLLRYQPNRFFITVGASYAYLIDYYEESEAGNLTGKHPFDKSEYSCNIGLGMTFYKKFDVEVRSNNSFMPIRSFGSGYTPYYGNFLARTFNQGYYNNILQIVFTYKLTPKKKSESIQN